MDAGRNNLLQQVNVDFQVPKFQGLVRPLCAFQRQKLFHAVRILQAVNQFLIAKCEQVSKGQGQLFVAALRRLREQVEHVTPLFL